MKKHNPINLCHKDSSLAPIVQVLETKVPIIQNLNKNHKNRHKNYRCFQ
uniref:Uncharacterized protein n=1 Tax=Rhizophora mucronata TaxID=61149 RepID=A0A2P2NCG1_RHIMU